jgi:hypothetical protein
MHHGVPIVDKELKAEVIFNHFDEILGAVVEWTHGVDMDCIGLKHSQVPTINQCFFEEVWNIIQSMTPDKAPGPDGFMGRFFQVTWPIVKRDILQALTSIWSLDTRSLYLLNQAYMVLLRKKKDAEEIKDFRPINLIHCFSKLFIKMLSSRLAHTCITWCCPTRVPSSMAGHFVECRYC